MPSRLVTRLGQYTSLWCVTCNTAIDGSWNDVVSVKKRYAAHLRNSPSCQGRPAASFARRGRIDASGP